MKHKTILIFLALILSFSAHCGPARKGIISLTQPDGTVFNARLKGDEFFRLTTTLDGCAIVQDRDGWWCYALFDNEGNRSSSGCKVGKKAPSAILSESRMIPYEVLSASAGEKRRKFSFTDSGIWKDSGLLTTRNGGQSVKHGIVILAQFSDIRFKYEKQDFADLLTKDGYSRNGATGSAKEYFEQQLAGKVNFEFEVSDIVTLPEKREEYGANMPDGEDKDPTRMIIEACQAADEQIDFTLYDEDKDGKIDNVFVFFAGGDESQGAGEECIWSHSWSIYEGSGQSIVLDGKQLDSYACSSELTTSQDGTTSQLSGIGTFCHEYGHTLGLVDLYDTDYSGSGGESAGLWIRTSLMDGGNHNNEGNTPPYLNAIEREMLGICSPIRIDSDGSYSLGPIEQTNTVYRLDTDNEDEYYLLECRSGDGWDAHIGGKGLLVYHIDRSDRTSGYSDSYNRNLKASERWGFANEVNCRPDHQCADLLEADGRDDIFSDILPTDISTIFFPQNGITSIIPDGVPGFRFWSGKLGAAKLSDIRWEDGKIMFNISGISENKVPPGVSAVEIETFTDAAIIRFESDRIFEGNAIVEWGRIGEKMQTTVIQAYEPGKYAALLEGLQPDNKTYNVVICFEIDGVKGGSKNITLMTRKSPSVSWPYIHMTGVKKKADGTIPYGSPIPLRVCNASDAAEINWTFNGRKIVVEGDQYYRLIESGTLKAHIIWEDGSEDNIIKEIRLSGEE